MPSSLVYQSIHHVQTPTRALTGKIVDGRLHVYLAGGHLDPVIFSEGEELSLDVSAVQSSHINIKLTRETP